MKQENVIRLLIGSVMVITVVVFGIFLKAISLVNKYVENIPQASINSMNMIEGFIWLILFIVEIVLLLSMFLISRKKR